VGFQSSGFTFSQSGPKEEGQSAADKEAIHGGFQTKPLDGAVIQAVEKYVNPSNHEIALSVGAYPFNPYYLGFEGSASYTYYFDESWAWEVVHGTYVFPVNKDLQNELADLGYTPQQVNHLNFLVSTSAEYIFAYGKALFFKDAIRYFRASGLLGAGIAGEDLDTKLAINQGLKFEFYVASSFSWKLEVRNSFTFGKSGSNGVGTGSSVYPSVHLGVGIGL
jgi:hypothetical protein